MSPTFKFLLVCLVGYGVTAMVTGSRGSSASALEDAVNCDARPEACDFEWGEPGEPTHATAPESEVCAGAGYLCAGLAERGNRRILRWNETTEEIRVRVPRPSMEDKRFAKQLQDAAVRGIRAWQGRPFPIRISTSDRPGEEDFVVQWAQVLGAVELGEAETEWTLADGVADLRVVGFSLATRNPHAADRRLDPKQVELTSAHEMGHALGLPHSDDERDVMFPSNTATRLTRRDFQTMEALYRLENGLELLPAG